MIQPNRTWKEGKKGEIVDSWLQNERLGGIVWVPSHIGLLCCKEKNKALLVFFLSFFVRQKYSGIVGKKTLLNFGSLVGTTLELTYVK